MEVDANKQDTALDPENKEKCTIHDCVAGVDQRKSQYSTSKRYQLQRYHTFEKNYCTFICTNFVEVPKYLQEISMGETSVSRKV